MHTLDSRSLQYVNCFAQKFTVRAHVQYIITTAAGVCLPVDGETFTIDVNERKASSKESKQHDVTVRLEGRRLVASPAHLEIEVGDTVLWNAPAAATPGYAIRGEWEGGGFDSSSLSEGAVYTHAFGLPGHYRWVDANGSALSGVVEVRSLDHTKRQECERWLKVLSDGTLILIRGDHASPDKVQILTGQTVFFAVEKAPGVSITDARLVRQQAPPKPGPPKSSPKST
ncbi:MAG: hypothetical protein HY238_08060 [Acidobacteria bacterium]|nr:hypothetical protein [Acidobacteriota bacterium]